MSESEFLIVHMVHHWPKELLIWYHAVLSLGQMAQLIIIILGIHIYADQPRAHKVYIISLESEHSKLKSSISTCIE